MFCKPIHETDINDGSSRCQEFTSRKFHFKKRQKLNNYFIGYTPKPKWTPLQLQLNLKPRRRKSQEVDGGSQLYTKVM